MTLVNISYLNSFSQASLTLIASAGFRVAAEGVNVRLVSFPSWELFDQQEKEYRDSVLPPNIKTRLAVEAGITLGWERWVGDGGEIIGVNQYGASAPVSIIFEKYGLTAESVIQKVMGLVRGRG